MRKKVKILQEQSQQLSVKKSIYEIKVVNLCFRNVYK